MRRPVATRPGTYLRKPARADAAEFVAGGLASRGHLLPWVQPPDDVSGYRSWMAQGQRADAEQFLVCRRADDTLAGFVTLDNIVLGTLQSAAIGWAAFDAGLGHGHLTDGVEMVLDVAFTQVRLHRVEANIQPGNHRSRRLALRCGFALEGFSPRYLRIGGEWRDHERWAVNAEDRRARRR